MHFIHSHIYPFNKLKQLNGSTHQPDAVSRPQVRFGVLNAGNFGVPQSRKRTIIWAAAPDETLPQWPRKRHVFHSPQLTINLPGGVQYCAVPSTPGAPLRAVTVKDAIADLPAITNGSSM